MKLFYIKARNKAMADFLQKYYKSCDTRVFRLFNYLLVASKGRALCKNYGWEVRVLNTWVIRNHIRVSVDRLMRVLNHELRMAFGNSPIYFEVWSRDCDMFETYNYVEYPSYKAWYNTVTNPDFYEGLEGDFNEREISREEYYEREGVVLTRDRVLEAFENGDNYYV